jgi:ABC-type lipoprotein export system ATPase subunit
MAAEVLTEAEDADRAPRDLVAWPLILRELTILPGHDKSGLAESFERIELSPGDLVALVGPTGAGKSRLLADVEWQARGDTPSGRRILVDGNLSQVSSRYRIGGQLVAQLSQTMTFMVDLTVGPFLELHAQSRGLKDLNGTVAEVLDAANQLAGESFTVETSLSRLSGGQSRALMIADTALISRSPIVLVDEIENAGIDRRRALQLLLSNEKIVIMSTHDPLLALQAQRRVIIRNGGVQSVVERTATELRLLLELEAMDERIQSVRDQLRRGKPLM